MKNLAKFKIPSVIEFMSAELPRNATGKVLKRALKESATIMFNEFN